MPRAAARTDGLLAYHESTKHSPDSVRRSGHVLDFGNQPLPFKYYPTLAPLPLPRPEAVAAPALASLAALPAADRLPVPDAATVAQLLHFSAGIIRERRGPGWRVQFRAASCTGALYHIDLYLVCGDLPGLPAGVYHYGPHDSALRRLRAGDFRAVLLQATAGDPAMARAPAVLVLASTIWRNAWKYRARAYRHVFWDAGTILANALAVSAALGLPAHLVTGFQDRPVDDLLGLDGRREMSVALLPVGRERPTPATAPAVAPLSLPTEPLSRFEVDYPEIRAAHAASSLPTDGAVRAWRHAALPAEPAPPGEWLALSPVEGPAPAADSLSAVIERRGSSRAFARRPIRLQELSVLLHAAARGLSADFLAEPTARATALHLIVHAVDDLPGGAYRYEPRRHALRLLREGEFRPQAGFLALEQSLAADAAVNVYCLADLPSLISRLGPRAYRAAQLEGGITGGRLYLAAYALRLGATGLTFYDDEVTSFFGPQAGGSSPMFLTAVGHPRRPHA